MKTPSFWFVEFLSSHKMIIILFKLLSLRNPTIRIECKMLYCTLWDNKKNKTQRWLLCCSCWHKNHLWWHRGNPWKETISTTSICIHFPYEKPKLHTFISTDFYLKVSCQLGIHCLLEQDYSRNNHNFVLYIIIVLNEK